MNTNIIINENKKTIEITKKFAAAAKCFGTTEYEDLQTVRRDYPQFRVVERKASKKSDSFKGLTFDYMEKYILNHDDEEMKKSFYTLCGKDENGNSQEMAATASYGEIKSWFIAQHKEFAAQRSKIDEILNKKAA